MGYKNEEPKIVKVPSPGDGKYWEQIEVDGKSVYCFYQSDTLKSGEDWGYDHFHVLSDGDDDKQIHYNPVKNPLWYLPGEPREYDDDLWDEVKAYVYSHIDFPDDRLYDVATAWIFYTWLPEAFTVAPYFRLYGVKNSGKTRVLEVFQNLCRRAILTPSTSEAALYRLIQDYHVTFLLDESEVYGNEAKAAIQNVLNSGYKRGQQVLRCVNAEDGSIIVEGYDVFGPKALGSTRELKDTLESRCIPVVMTRNSRQVAFMVDTRAAKALRSKLLLWRFRRLADLNTVSEGSEGSEYGEGYLEGGYGNLHQIKNSRIVEIYSPLITLTEDETSRNNIINYAVDMYASNQEEESSGVEAQVLQAITRCYNDLESGKFSTKMVKSHFNEDRPENEHWKSTSIGRVIKRLGFNPKRMSGGASGWVYDANHIEKLQTQYAPVSEGQTPPLDSPSPPSLPSLLSPNMGVEEEQPKSKVTYQGLKDRIDEVHESMKRGNNSLEDIADDVGLPVDGVKTLLGVLLRDEVVFQPRPGYWRLT